MLVLHSVQKPIAGRFDERISDVIVPAVQGENNPPLVAIMLLPPSDNGDALVGIDVPQMIKIVIVDVDRESICSWFVR